MIRPKVSLSADLFNENRIHVRLSRSGELIGYVEESKGSLHVTMLHATLRTNVHFDSRKQAVDFIVTSHQSLTGDAKKQGA